MTKQEIIDRFNKETSVRTLETKCLGCGSTNITGISVTTEDKEIYEDAFFNLKTGNVENFDGEVIESTSDFDKGYYLLCIREQLEKGEELVSLCRDHEDYVDVIELTFSNGIKLDSLMDDFNEIILYLLNNGLIDFEEQ